MKEISTVARASSFTNQETIPMKRHFSVAIVVALVTSVAVNTMMLATNANAQTYQGCDPGEICR